MFCAVSDTTNSALKAGSLIADGRVAKGGTTCVMHAQELCLKHALGVAIRKQNHVVVDEFPIGKTLRDNCKVLASKLTDKKVKARWVEAVKISKDTWDVEPTKLCVPNDTQISGTFLLFQSILRSKNLISVLKGHTKYWDVYVDYLLNKEQYNLVAEFTAVMIQTNHLAVASQTEEPGEVAFSWFGISMARLRFKDRNKPYVVVDTTQSWPPNKSFEDLPVAKIPYDLLQEETKTFIQRLINEFDKYFPAPDSDQVIAMILHPIIRGRCLK